MSIPIYLCLTAANISAMCACFCAGGRVITRGRFGLGVAVVTAAAILGILASLSLCAVC